MLFPFFRKKYDLETFIVTNKTRKQINMHYSESTYQLKKISKSLFKNFSLKVMATKINLVIIITNRD